MEHGDGLQTLSVGQRGNIAQIVRACTPVPSTAACTEPGAGSWGRQTRPSAPGNSKQNRSQGGVRRQHLGLIARRSSGTAVGTKQNGCQAGPKDSGRLKRLGSAVEKGWGRVRRPGKPPPRDLNVLCEQGAMRHAHRRSRGVWVRKGVLRLSTRRRLLREPAGPELSGSTRCRPGR